VSPDAILDPLRRLGCKNGALAYARQADRRAAELERAADATEPHGQGVAIARARWSVDLIRNRAQRLGTVVAKTEKEATAIAIKQFDIEPVRQNRTIVTKISNPNDA
jgi:hypothetical protein